MEETTQKSNVTVKIVNSSGQELMQFPASKTGSFTEDAEKAWFEIPTACGAGACFFCAGHVKSGMEYVDMGKISVPLVDLEEDQILTCIAWAKAEHFNDGQPREIVIEKDI